MDGRILAQLEGAGTFIDNGWDRRHWVVFPGTPGILTLTLQVAEGQAEARLTIAFPLVAELPVEVLRIRATARVTEARLPGVLLDQELDRAAFELAVDTDTLKASGTALLGSITMRRCFQISFIASTISASEAI